MKAKLCTGVIAGLCMVILIPGAAGGMAAGSSAGTVRATKDFSVSLTVEDALGVSLDGRISSDRAIRIGDPAAGLVSYVILDG